jgi:hypothetical protein
MRTLLYLIFLVCLVPLFICAHLVQWLMPNHQLPPIAAIRHR